MKTFLSAILIFCTFSAALPQKITKIILEEGEVAWASVINEGSLMPFTTGYSMDFYGNNKSNQLSPLILTSRGQFAWSEEPYSFTCNDKEIVIIDPYDMVVTGRAGKTLAEVQRFVSGKYFPPSGLLPDTLLFAAPQYNTWIELTYHQNEEGVLNYARGIIKNGLPAGVLMIDDTWQEDYGFWDFHPGRFRDPKSMVDKLHDMGFKVMLWVVPFVSPDQTLIYTDLRKKKAFLLEQERPTDTWNNAPNPIMIRWWNGVSAELDFTNPAAVDWFNGQLGNLVSKYGVDGFKFDAADMNFYPADALSREKVTPNEHCRLYTQFGLKYPLNEYRACWKMGGQPLAQRLLDKAHDWSDVQKLIPEMIIEGLCGYTFSCPDMIGGGLWTTFQDESKIDQELMVRSAQCNALMPMMQFSVAPWRVVNKEHMAAIKKCIYTRIKFTPLLMKLAKESATTGEPILKAMEYVFPGEGMEMIKDQFMLGNNLLVAPVVEKGIRSRTVVLPKGSWKADDGKTYRGGKPVTIEVPLYRLPYFEKIR